MNIIRNKICIVFLISVFLVASVSAATQTHELGGSKNKPARIVTQQEFEVLMEKMKAQYSQHKAGKSPRLSPDELKQLQEDSKLIQEYLRNSINKNEYRPANKKKPVSKNEFEQRYNKSAEKKKPLTQKNSIERSKNLIGKWENSKGEKVELKYRGDIYMSGYKPMFWHNVGNEIILSKGLAGFSHYNDEVISGLYNSKTDEITFTGTKLHGSTFHRSASIPADNQNTSSTIPTLSVPDDDLIVGAWKDKDNKIVEFTSDGKVTHDGSISLFKRYQIKKWGLKQGIRILKDRDPAVNPMQSVIITAPNVTQESLTIKMTSAYGSLNSNFTRVSALKELTVFSKKAEAKRAESKIKLPRSLQYELSLQTGHSEQVELVRFSPDGQYIASYDSKNSLVLWSKETGRQIRSFHPVSCDIEVNYSGVGKSHLGSNSAWRKKNITIDGVPCERSILQKHLEKGITIESFVERVNDVDTLAFSPDGKYLLTGGNDEHLKLYDISTGAVVVSYNSQATQYPFGSVLQVGFSDSGKYMVTAGFHPGGELNIANVKTSEIINSIRTDASYFSYVDFMPLNDNHIISAESKEKFGPGTIKIWDVHSKKLIKQFIGHKERIVAISVSPNGKLIISGSENGEVILWNISTGKMIKIVKKVAKNVTNLNFFSDNNRVLISAGSQIQILDINNNKTRVINSGTKTLVKTQALDKEGEYLVVSYEGESALSLWNIPNNKLIRTFVSYTQKVGRVRYSEDNTKILMYGESPRYWDLITGREGSDKRILNAMLVSHNKSKVRRHPQVLPPPPLRGFKRTKISVTGPNGKYKITTTGNGIEENRFVLLNNKTGQRACNLKHPFSGAYGAVGDVRFSRNGNFIIGERKSASRLSAVNAKSYPENTTVFIWEVKSCQVVHTFQQTNRTIDLKVLLDSPNGKYAVLENAQRNLVLYQVAEKVKDVTTAEYNWPPGNSPNLIERQTLSGFKGSTDDVQFSKNSKRLLTGGDDVKITIWDIASGSRVVSILPLRNGKDSIIYTPDNRYISTKHAFNALAITNGLKTFSFEQFDLLLNRPDQVLEKLSGNKSKVTALYYQAYLKRIKKLGFTTEMLNASYHAPEIDIDNKIPLSTSNQNIAINIKAQDSLYTLKRLNIWVNDVPYYGSNGINLESKNLKVISKNINIPLSSGNNKIQVSVVNNKGVESDKAEKLVHLDVPNEKPDLHIIAIGVSKYKNSKMNLNYAAKDATDFVDTFVKKKDLYNKIYIHKYTDKEATLANIVDIKTKLLKTRVDDSVLLFYAGHGVLDKNFDYFLATHNMNFNNPSNNGLAYEELESLIDGIPARHKIIFIDACHSGEVDKDEVVTKLSSYVIKGSPVKFSRGFTNKSNRQIVGLSNSFALARELFVDLRRRSGATVISSAGGAELAVENDKWKNGVFSYCLFEGLRNNNIDSNKDSKTMVSELQGYLLQCVSKLTDNLQKPTSRAENLSNDFRIW